MRRINWFGMLCLVGATTTLVACGDNEESNSSYTTSSVSVSAASSTAAGTGGMGTGGAAGTGGAVGTGGMGGTGGAGGAGGTGGTGGAGGGTNLLNGCDPATAEDHTTDAAVTIDFGGMMLGNTYSPACIRVKAGTDVTFQGNFVLHPLEGGTVVAMVPTPDPSSPIQNPPMGSTTATFTLSVPGDYGYYCVVHYPFGMMGAVFVVP